MKKIVFITGTRADYGKIKSIILKLQSHKKFKVSLYVTGMHNLSIFGSTYNEIIKDKIINIKRFNNQKPNESMDNIFSKTSFQFSKFIKKFQPDLIVVHGDRVEALSCAIIGCLNNIKIAHIEGGELSGTVDEMIRHSISKIANYHFVTNKFARKRLLQMGEKKNSIFVIGSPDIDIILSKKLPPIDIAKKRYGIKFKNYAVAILHPVTTNLKSLKKNTSTFLKSIIKSRRNFILIYPNNDLGQKIILKYYKNLNKRSNFKIFRSLRFEYFLTILKNAQFIIGNSSSGIIEAPYYGTPCINLGDRQKNRAKIKSVINCQFHEKKIINNIKKYENTKFNRIKYFGSGNSDKKFINILKKNKNFWNKKTQKYFNEIN